MIAEKVSLWEACTFPCSRRIACFSSFPEPETRRRIGNFVDAISNCHPVALFSHAGQLPNGSGAGIARVCYGWMHLLSGRNTASSRPVEAGLCRARLRILARRFAGGTSRGGPETAGGYPGKRETAGCRGGFPGSQAGRDAFPADTVAVGVWLESVPERVSGSGRSKVTGNPVSSMA